MSTVEAFLPLVEPDALASVVSAKAMSAGKEIMHGEAVTDLVIDKESVRGRVRGTSGGTHETSLTLTRQGLVCACTCPTFVDGWEKVCHHGVALALTLRQTYQRGDEMAVTQNPWVTEVSKAATRGRRYQIEYKRPHWLVKSFDSGSSMRAMGGGTSWMTPADRIIRAYLDQEIDQTEEGAHVLEATAMAGLLYFARESSVSLKGAGRLTFPKQPLVLRVQAESRERDQKVELHAFLEHVESGRRFELDDGELIGGAPSFFVVASSGEAFLVLDTPPWVLDAVAKQPRILMDARIDAEHMDQLSAQLQAVGVPRQDLFALASDKREIEQIIATIEGDGERVKVELAARYGNVTLGISGVDPASARYSMSMEGETISFYRDLDGESAARKALTDLKVAWSDTLQCFTAVADEAIEFIVAGIPLLPEAWERRVPKMPKVRSKSPSAKVSVRNRGSVLDVDAVVDVEGDDSLLSFRDLLRWLHEGRRWATLTDGSVVKLDARLLAPIAEAAGGLDFDKKGHVELSTLELGTLSRLLGAVPDAQVAKEVKQLMSNMTGEKSGKAPKKAKALAAKLREYQQSGFAWLWQLHENRMTGILADDMGLGKTVQALALLTKAQEMEGSMPSLIVCPTSVLSVWKGEVKKWAPSFNVLVWHGADRAENRRLLKKSDIVVTSYTLLRRDIEELAKIKFRYVILDEAQYIKNWTTSTAKATKEVNAEHRLAMSGTPVENHLVDLWAIFDFLAPGFLGTITEFQRTYVRPIEDGDRAALEGLRARVRPFVLRRRKEDVASELPPKTEQSLYVQMGTAQLALYNRILKAAKTEIMGKIEDLGLEKSQMTILAALTRLRQVCTDPHLLGLPEGTVVPPSAKLEAFRELIADCIGSGRKVLVFSQFVEMQKILGEVMTELGIEYLWLHGGTKNREELVNQFQRKDGPPVFLISLKAGGSGLTLTEADTVIHYDPWWNPAVEDQATDRAHRIGQDKPVMVYRLVIEGSVEQKMVDLGAQKREIAESALGRDSKGGKKLTMADVEALLESPTASPWDV